MQHKIQRQCDFADYTVTVTFMVKAEDHIEALELVNDAIDDGAPFLVGHELSFNIDNVSES